MAPGSRSKRVRASDESQVPPSGAETRSTKRAQTAERNGDPVQDPTDARDDISDNLHLDLLIRTGHRDLLIMTGNLQMKTVELMVLTLKASNSFESYKYGISLPDLHECRPFQ